MNSNEYFHIPQLAKRKKKAARFRLLTLMSLIASVTFLVFFLSDMFFKGYGAFTQTYVKVPVNINQKTAKFSHLAVDRKEYGFAVSRAWLRGLPNRIKENPSWMDTQEERWTLANSNVDQYIKGKYNRLKPKQIEKIKQMNRDGKVERRFNNIFFKKGDSKIPEFSGFMASILGTVMTMVITMLIAVPLGIMTAVYLEEFASDNKFTQMIEININNLAAIPSILFGLLGLAVFINFFGVPRSSPLVGGMTLALMSLPVIVVSSKAALKSVPDSIRQAGFALGLTKWQIVRDHVLPISSPGMLTGAIIALAQAMGETAPLIMVGMIAFIPDISTSFMDATTVMPAQIYTWSGMPERAYVERTAAGILVLLGILLSLNAIAIYLRKKYTKTW
ncbi:phosphate ABC transporter permease PstA [Sulfurospirillum arcachonense]|uniref:phosphate ABC transporter permease PstA n=1 Tax=Sulfurospirillum arcachonense TaxID=57666 RepID=UPI0004689604|nr:phosphate ABC transporter permease PstA [Sulfurospirillum arcachonense]